jgi:hypothetical protein
LIPDYYYEKVNLFVALAPAVFMSHCSAELLVDLSKHWGILQRLIQRWGLYDIISLNWWETQASIDLCHFVPSICRLGLESLADINPDVDNLERGNAYLGHFPDGAGYKALLHYAQGI